MLGIKRLSSDRKARLKKCIFEFGTSVYITVWYGRDYGEEGEWELTAWWWGDGKPTHSVDSTPEELADVIADLIWACR